MKLTYSAGLAFGEGDVEVVTTIITMLQPEFVATILAGVSYEAGQETHGGPARTSTPNPGPVDPYGGAHDLAPSDMLRPLSGQPSHHTAVPTVYLLGGTWPGHGLNGGSGYIVARQLLDDGGEPG